MMKLTFATLASFNSVARLAQASDTRPAKSMRYVLQIVLGGGIDSIFSTDPKERSEVDPDVDIPYAPGDVLSAGRMRFGPHFAPLAKWAPRMTIVNGVFVGVANHPAGMRQLLRLRLGGTNDMPTALEVVGSQRDGQALPCVTMEPIMDGAASSFMGDDVFDVLEKASPDDLKMMARVSRQRGKGIQFAGGPATRNSIEDCATFFERLANTPRFEPKPDTESHVSLHLQRATWLFQHDLTRCVTMDLGSGWDTHVQNTQIQTALSLPGFGMLAEALAQMEKTTNQHGSVLDNTLIVMCSELGRYPVLNPRAGKDHFPEVPVIFFNAPAGRGEVFGRTGRRRQALPFARKTSNRVTLTDVGNTVLRLAGVAPETRGYDGAPLEFLGV